MVGEGPRASRSEGDDRVVNKSLSGLVECHVTLGQLRFLCCVRDTLALSATASVAAFYVSGVGNDI